MFVCFVLLCAHTPKYTSIEYNKIFYKIGFSVVILFINVAYFLLHKMLSMWQFINAHFIAKYSIDRGCSIKCKHEHARAPKHKTTCTLFMFVNGFEWMLCIFFSLFVCCWCVCHFNWCWIMDFLSFFFHSHCCCCCVRFVLFFCVCIATLVSVIY